MISAKHPSSWPRPIYLLAVFAVVLAAACSAVYLLHRHSSREFNIAVQNDELAMTAFHYNTSAWRYVIAAVTDAHAPTAATAEELSTSRQLLAQATAAFRAETGEGNKLAIRSDIDQMDRGTVAALQLVDEGLPDQAMAAMNETHDPYYSMADQAFIFSQQYIDNARRAAAIADLATVVVFILAFLAVALAYWRYRVAQRRGEKMEAEQEILRRSEARFRPLVQSSADAIAVIDERNEFIYASPAIRNLTGLDPEEAVHRSVLDFLVSNERHAFEAFISDVRNRANFSSATEVELVPGHLAKESRFVHVVCTNRLHDPDVRGLVLNIHDITERRVLENQLRHQAFYDSLTGLANRLRFMDRLDYALLRTRRSGREKVGVLYMDLDHFKYVNDERGHTIGDELLKQVGSRLMECIRPIDTAARLGGDEFAVLLEDAPSTDAAHHIADRVLAAIARPFVIEGHEIHITASLGLVTTDTSMSTEDVIRNADVAMYDAKESGRNRVHVFESGMQISLVERLRLISELNEAVEHDQFVIYYQPEVDLESGGISGFEALVRWEHPTRGLLEPVEFIALAEETGAIHELGRIVLERACVQMKVWETELPQTRDMTMSVNLSAKQLARDGFVESVKATVEESGLDPHRLVLEVTESVLVPQPLQALTVLDQLKRLGIRVALDDFGTGYSSLSYLKRFPIDILKIDRSFIDGVDTVDKDRLLVQTVIDLGNTLNLEVVAEGIERQEQMERLKLLHCAVGQGYLFSRPLAPKAITELLAKETSNAPPSPSPAANPAA